jgi:hypothetical protein
MNLSKPRPTYPIFIYHSGRWELAGLDAVGYRANEMQKTQFWF